MMQVKSNLHYLLILYLLWQILRTPANLLDNLWSAVFGGGYLALLIVAIYGIYKKNKMGPGISMFIAFLSFVTVVNYVVNFGLSILWLSESIIFFLFSYYLYNIFSNIKDGSN